MKHVICISYDDWAGVYVDGELDYEGHSIESFHIARAAGSGPITFEDKNVNEEAWYRLLDKTGRLPENFSDIPEEVYE